MLFSCRLNYGEKEKFYSFTKFKNTSISDITLDFSNSVSQIICLRKRLKTYEKLSLNLRPNGRSMIWSQQWSHFFTRTDRTIRLSIDSSPSPVSRWLDSGLWATRRTVLRSSSAPDIVPKQRKPSDKIIRRTVKHVMITRHTLSKPLASSRLPNTSPMPAKSVTAFSPIGSDTKLWCFWEVVDIVADLFAVISPKTCRDLMCYSRHNL